MLVPVSTCRTTEPQLADLVRTHAGISFWVDAGRGCQPSGSRTGDGLRLARHRPLLCRVRAGGDVSRPRRIRPGDVAGFPPVPGRSNGKTEGFRVLSCRSIDQRLDLITDDVAVFTHRVRKRLAGESATFQRERETIVFRRESDGRWLGIDETICRSTPARSHGDPTRTSDPSAQGRHFHHNVVKALRRPGYRAVKLAAALDSPAPNSAGTPSRSAARCHLTRHRRSTSSRR